MTVNESRNYKIAILCSIAFHLLLCFLYFPQNVLPTTNEIETLSVGLFEVSPEFNLSEEQNQVIVPTNELAIVTKPKTTTAAGKQPAKTGSSRTHSFRKSGRIRFFSFRPD
jgi:hypothetical protein